MKMHRVLIFMFIIIGGQAMMTAVRYPRLPQQLLRTVAEQPLLDSAFNDNVIASIVAMQELLPLSFNQRMFYTRRPPAGRDILFDIDDLEDVVPAVLQQVVAVDTTSLMSNECGDQWGLLKGLIYLRAGALDEAHEIIQLLTEHDAVYAHALLHRLEGGNVGELGLTGWGNSGYWVDQIGSSHAIFPDVCTFTYALSRCEGIDGTNVRNFAANEQVQELFQKFLPARAKEAAEQGRDLVGYWNADRFLRFVIQCYRSGDPTAHEFCALVTNYECEMLIDSVLTKLCIK